MNMSGQFGISAPATPPTAGSTVAVFDSTKAFNKLGLQANQITRVKIDFAGLDQPSASGGLIGYKSRDKGATWYHCAFAYAGGSATLPATVAADTGSDSNSYDIFVGTAADVKFEFTASGTAPTVWPPTVTLQAGVPQSGQ